MADARTAIEDALSLSLETELLLTVFYDRITDVGPLAALGDTPEVRQVLTFVQAITRLAGLLSEQLRGAEEAILTSKQ